MPDLQRGDEVAYQVWRFNRSSWEWELVDRPARVVHVAEIQPGLRVPLPHGRRGEVARLSRRAGVAGALVHVEGLSRAVWLALDELSTVHLLTPHDGGKRFSLPRGKVIAR